MKNQEYRGRQLDCVAFPLGGIGAGMILLTGRGSLSGISIRHRPDILNEPLCTYSALHIRGDDPITRIIEGPLPETHIHSRPTSWNGLSENYSWGLPRLAGASFSSKFPFGYVSFEDDSLPLDITLTGWSPFIPGDADSSSLPMIALEYSFASSSVTPLEAVYSFNSLNFMDITWDDRAEVRKTSDGFIFWQPGSQDEPWQQGAFCARVDSHEAAINCAWFRGRIHDSFRDTWSQVEQGTLLSRDPFSSGRPGQGASISVPLCLDPGETTTVRLMLSWYVPYTNYQWQTWANGDSTGYRGKGSDTGYYRPWYAGRFCDIESVADTWARQYEDLRGRSQLFSEAFFDTTLPEDVIEAVEANLTIFKSPTILRQHDGRIWAYEGCADTIGSCEGSCTHVWNYAQAMAHLFPDLERSLRQTEFNEAMSDNGHQSFRVPMPINGSFAHAEAAADGQLGGIIKAYRDWRISGDMQWLEHYWPKVKQSITFCIQHWDPDHEGIVKEPHHNTYDIEFWGPDGMCTSIYLAALQAARKMAKAAGDAHALYEELYEKGVKYLDEHLWNGEYYMQNVRWKDLRAGNPAHYKSLGNVGYTPEAREVLEQEGPKYQYANGCLSDGVIGFWMAEAAGLGKIGNSDRITTNLKSIVQYNLSHDLGKHINISRSGFALGSEGGLVLCTWPRGDKPSFPLVPDGEVWTGIEYQVAAHCIMNGLVSEGLDIVRTCRARYDGRKRNPYNEYECGHWYARAMASYSLLQALTGIRYDAVEKRLYVAPQIQGDMRCFIATAHGFGTVSIKDKHVRIDVMHGEIVVEDIVSGACSRVS